jgi:membrane fusion protein, multidrug efflux system
MKKKLKTIFSVIIGILFMVLLMMWMSGSFHEKIEPMEEIVGKAIPIPQNAEFSPIKQLERQTYEQAVGTVEAATKTTIAAKILASIEEITVTAGNTVKKGDLLVRLDDRDLQSSLSQAKQSALAAQASLNEALSKYNRAEQLLAGNSISDSEFEQIEAAYKSADANKKKVDKAVEQTEVALTNSEIKSPVDGRVVERFAEPGDLASPGRPLMSIYDPNVLRIEAPVRENLGTHLKIGDPLTVKIDALDITVDGWVDEIVPQAEAATRSFLVKVGIPKQEGLYTGMYGRIIIPTEVREFYCIAEAAIEKVGQLEFAYVKKGKNLERRLIRTGEEGENGRKELLSGLGIGEEVMLLGK